MLSIFTLLHDLGYPVRPDQADREQQFPCDLHGDGRDGKPSARAYPDSNSWYCFACGYKRGIVRTLQDKLGLSRENAHKYLKDKYGVVFKERVENPERAPLALEFDRPQVNKYEVLHSTLKAITQDRDLPLENILALWEAFDAIASNPTPDRVGRIADEIRALYRGTTT